MRLAEWRKQQGYDQKQLADALGVTQPTVSYLERSPDRAIGKTQVPKPDLMRRIWTLTKGAVAPNDFYDLPSIDQLEFPDLAPANSAPLFDLAEGGER
jgi:hypothetical protein